MIGPWAVRLRYEQNNVNSGGIRATVGSMTSPTDTSAEEPGYREALGRAIRVLRTERGLERKDLAERSGLSYAYLSEIETGKKRASSKALFAIAEALGVRPHEVLAVADRYAGATPTERALSTVVLEATRSQSAPSPPQMPAPPAPAGAAPAAAVWSPPPHDAPGWRWSRPETGPAVRASSVREPSPSPAGAPSRPTPSRGRNDRSARNETIRELLATTDRLTDEDLVSLVELAQRLAR